MPPPLQIICSWPGAGGHSPRLDKQRAICELTLGTELRGQKAVRKGRVGPLL